MLDLSYNLGKLSCRKWVKLEENVVTVGREGGIDLRVLSASPDAQLDFAGELMPVGTTASSLAGASL